MNKIPKTEGHRHKKLDIQKIKPLFKKYGITRIGDITGLDVIGIPVTSVSRPNSRTISINSGKGLSTHQAVISGAMEALEIATAEDWRGDVVHRTHQQLGGSAVPLDRIAYTKNSIFRPDLVFAWEPMRQIDGSGYEVFVPSSQVGMHPQYEGYDYLMAFQIGSNGLASGGCMADAILSGIYEVIERDAWTISALKSKHGIDPKLVDLGTIKDESIQSVIGLLDKAGVELFLFDVTLDTAPVYGAYIADRNQKGVGVFTGYGCHLDPTEAAMRAILEACQGRACYIAGARDDLFRRQFVVLKRQVDALEKLRSLKPSIDFSYRENEASDFVDTDAGKLMAKLALTGHVVLVREMTESSSQISVARVMIPGFEGHNFEYYSPGNRAMEFLKHD